MQGVAGWIARDCIELQSAGGTRRVDAWFPEDARRSAAPRLLAIAGCTYCACRACHSCRPGSSGAELDGHLAAVVAHRQQRQPGGLPRACRRGAWLGGRGGGVVAGGGRGRGDGGCAAVARGGGDRFLGVRASHRASGPRLLEPDVPPQPAPRRAPFGIKGRGVEDAQGRAQGGS